MTGKFVTIGLIGSLSALLASNPALASKATTEDTITSEAATTVPEDTAFVRDRLEILNLVQSMTPALDE